MNETAMEKSEQENPPVPFWKIDQKRKELGESKKTMSEKAGGDAWLWAKLEKDGVVMPGHKYYRNIRALLETGKAQPRLVTRRKKRQPAPKVEPAESLSRHPLNSLIGKTVKVGKIGPKIIAVDVSTGSVHTLN